MKVAVIFELPEAGVYFGQAKGLTESLHEALCQAIHEGNNDAIAWLNQYIVDISTEPTSAVAYLQGADGSETTLNITEPDPADGTYCVHLDKERWVRIVPAG